MSGAAPRGEPDRAGVDPAAEPQDSADGRGGRPAAELDAGERLRRALAAPALATWVMALGLVGVHAALLYVLAEARESGSSWLELALSPVPPEVLDQLGALRPEALSLQGWWRLVSSALLHGGGLHLLLNTSALVILGRPLERLHGTLSVPAAFVAGALGGGLAALVAGVAGVAVGASGAVLGVAGALLTGSRGAALPRQLVRSLRRRLLAVLVVVLAGGLLWNRLVPPGYGRIGNAAHLGGLAAGLLLGLGLPAPGAEVAGAQRALARALTAALVLVGMAGLGQGASSVWAEASSRPRPVRLSTFLQAGGALAPRRLPELGLTLAVPGRWRLLRSDSGYASFGPSPGRPYLQLLSRPLASPLNLPNAIVEELEAASPRFYAAPFAHTRVGGRPAVRLELRYGDGDSDTVTQQIRYLVTVDDTVLHLVFLGTPPQASRVAEWIVGTVRFDGR